MAGYTLESVKAIVEREREILMLYGEDRWPSKRELVKLYGWAFWKFVAQHGGMQKLSDKFGWGYKERRPACPPTMDEIFERICIFRMDLRRNPRRKELRDAGYGYMIWHIRKQFGTLGEFYKVFVCSLCGKRDYNMMWDDDGRRFFCSDCLNRI